MGVLSCAPAQGFDTELYGETNEKDSWDRKSCAEPRGQEYLRLSRRISS
jgi:hypothetical protein